MKQRLLLLGSAFVVSFLCTACLTSVSEVQCSSDANCQVGERCVANVCLLPDGGVSNFDAGSTGGGATTGGGSAMGGGATTGGGGGGGSAMGGGSATGGGAVGGGTATGGGAPDAGTCGCVGAAGGRCQVGDSTLACGKNGAMCARCGTGEQCVAGACVVAACGPGTCSGCCGQGFCVTPTMQGGFACGASGNMCAQCGGGQRCVNGACVAPTACDVMSCPTGCCQGNQCQPGNTPRACGVAGATCQQCGPMNPCNAGVCQNGPFDGGMPPPPFDGGFPPPPTDGGMTGLPIGGACGTPGSTCTPPGFCLPETGTGYTGGYCSATCTMGACPTGAVCIAISQFGATTNACMSSCATPGSQSTCRTGYVCAPSASSVVQGYCRPLCTNGGLASCAAGQMCNTQTGLCQ